MSSLLGSLASSAGSAGSAIGSGLSSVGNATLSGLKSAGNAVADGASWLGNQSRSFGDWITSAKNWKGPIWEDSSAEITKSATTNATIPTSKVDMMQKFIDAEQKRREEIKRQQQLNAAYGLLQQMNGNNDNPYAWRAY